MCFELNIEEVSYTVFKLVLSLKDNCNKVLNFVDGYVSTCSLKSTCLIYMCTTHTSLLYIKYIYCMYIHTCTYTYYTYIYIYTVYIEREFWHETLDGAVQ